MDQKQVQEAIKRIDEALATLNCNRATHIQLVNDTKLVQQCCLNYFDDEAELKEKRDVRTDQQTDGPGVGNEDQQGSGDCVPGSERDESGDAPSQP